MCSLPYLLLLYYRPKGIRPYNTANTAIYYGHKDKGVSRDL